MNYCKIDVSIIIVNYNTAELLKDCINSIHEKTKDIIYEIIVVDNDSTDNSVEIVKKKFPNVKLIESDKNLGFGRANNLGAGHAKGKYLFLLNTDTLLINNSIKILFDFFEAYPKTGVAGGNLYHKNLKPNFSYAKNFPSLWNIFLYRSQIKKLYTNKRDIFNHTGKAKKVAFIIGADFFIKRELFNQLHGFDPDFFMYVEDCELSYRIHKLGYDSISVPESKIVHLQGRSSNTDQKLRMEIKNYILYFKKHYNTIYIYSYITLELIFIFARMLVFSLKKNRIRAIATKETMKYLIHKFKNLDYENS